MNVALLGLQAKKQELKLVIARLPGTAHEARKHLLQCRLFCLFGAGEKDSKLGFFVKTRRKLGMSLEKYADLLEASESAHGFKGSQGNGHFGLVIRISVGSRVLVMKTSGNVLVRMRLNGEGLPRTQNLEQKGQFPTYRFGQGRFFFVL